MESSTANCITGIIVGAVVGIGVGILIAPDKGSNTRKKMKDLFDSPSDDVLDKLNDFIESITAKVEKTIPNLEDILDRSVPNDIVAREAMIVLLEQKLEALKTAK